MPSRQLRTAGHGEKITLGDLEVVSWHTPGHAVHHIAWQIGGDVVTGDVGGIRFPGADHVAPPMPPPDIDVELWRESLELIRRLQPERLLLTHYGAFDDPTRHLDELEARLLNWTAIAEAIAADGGSRKDLAGALETLDEGELAAESLSGDIVARYRHLCPMPENSAGLYRYVVKRTA